MSALVGTTTLICGTDVLKTSRKLQYFLFCCFLIGRDKSRLILSLFFFCFGAMIVPECRIKTGVLSEGGALFFGVCSEVVCDVLICLRIKL